MPFLRHQDTSQRFIGDGRCVPHLVAVLLLVLGFSLYLSNSAYAATASTRLSPSSLTFAGQAIGTASAAQTITLRNEGWTTLKISSIAITGANVNDFKETSACGSSLGWLRSCTISVTFTPTASGARSADVTVTDNASGSSQSVTLTGTGAGTASASLSPGSLSFPSEPIGSPAPTQTVTLSNSGSAALSLSSISISGTNSSEFSESNTCGSSLAAGGSCTITVKFTPSASGTQTGDLSLADNAAGSPQNVTLTGTGAASSGTATATLSTTSLAFGNEPVDETSSSQTVTLSNAGTAALSITGISLGSTNAADFSEANTCGSSLAAGSSCNIAVLMTPAASGGITATLTIADNASGSPQSVSLSGTGTHDVTLSWTGSATSGVTGYNIFRGTTSGGEGTTPLNSSPITGTTFTDTNVQAGQTYYYVVTAVDGSTQSSDSNQASAVVP